MLSAKLTIYPHNEALREKWDAFVQRSKNRTFLFIGDNMDYHRDRFQDCSLLVFHDAEIVAVFPACRSGATVHRHQGLN
jgi:hypothetical protein